MLQNHHRNVVAAVALLVAACGGGASSNGAGDAGGAATSTTVTVTPPAAQMAPLTSRTFAAAVTGSSVAGVTWSVREGSSGGSVTSAGAYTAPAGVGTFHVVATSVADPAKSAFATITVVAPTQVTVTVSPKSVTLRPGASQVFTAEVSGSSNPGVTWTVQEGATGGAVSSTGAYTAPSTPGIYHVVATSVADGTRQDVATVTVASAASGWLTVVGNRIETPDGLPWHGRGANLHDTRGCGACTYNSPSVAEVTRRIDELVDNWHANFIRLDLESYAAANGQVNWAGILLDAGYLADIQAIVAHAVAKPGVYVLISLWADPSFTSLGWPTAATNQEWVKLADVFKNEPRVLYGIVNEPQANYDGAQDAQVWSAMNAAVQAIRDVETAAGTPHHVITVQGTRSWARVLDYYLTHPITAGGGVNIAYETHVYDGTSQFAARFETPSLTVPVIIGEFGPLSGSMTESDCATLMARAEASGVSYLAWTFHMRCPPNLLVDNSGGSCGVGMTLAPTSWGTLLKNRLATPW